jgi:hypothetical protein
MLICLVGPFLKNCVPSFLKLNKYVTLHSVICSEVQNKFFLTEKISCFDRYNLIIYMQFYISMEFVVQKVLG